MTLNDEYKQIQGNINIIRNSTVRAVNLIENFFGHPDIPGKPVVLDPSHRDLIDCIQFGFPLSQFTFGEIPHPPKGVVAIWRRQVGKSWSCAYGASALMIINPPFRVGVVAASEDESQYLIDKVKQAFDRSQFAKYVAGRPRLNLLKLKNGSFCRSHTCSKKSIHGTTYDVILIDESALMEEGILFAAAIPTVTHGRRWVAITTPQGNKGSIINYYYKGLETRPIICTSCNTHYKQNQFPDYSFPIDIMPNIPPCSKCGFKTWKYGMGIFAVPHLDPWNCSLIDPIELRAELDAHDWSPWARQELLGEILDEASMVILKEWIVKNTVKTLRNVMTPQAKIRYSLGADYGRYHDASCFCVTHIDPGTGRIVLDYLGSIAGEYDPDKDYFAIKQDLLKVIKIFRPMWVVPDTTGLGDPLVEELNRDIKNLGLRHTKIFNNKKDRLGFVISKKSKPDLIDNMNTLLARNPPALMLPPASEPEIEELVKELLRYECEVQDGGYIKYGTQNYHDDRVIAFALSLWAWNRTNQYYRAKPRLFHYGGSEYQGKPSIRYIRDINDEINLISV